MPEKQKGASVASSISLALKEKKETPCSGAPCCVSRWPWSFTFPPALQSYMCAETGAPSKSEGEQEHRCDLLYFFEMKHSRQRSNKLLWADHDISKVVVQDLFEVNRCQINCHSELHRYRSYIFQADFLWIRRLERLRDLINHVYYPPVLHWFRFGVVVCGDASKRLRLDTAVLWA